MASLNQRNLSSFKYPHSRPMQGQNLWRSIVKDRIKEQLDCESETEVSVFIVPKTLLTNSPNSYTPQHVALGSNQYWHPELHDMEGYKIAAAKRFQNQLQSQKRNFQDLVEQLFEHEAAIRACYQGSCIFRKKIYAG